MRVDEKPDAALPRSRHGRMRFLLRLLIVLAAMAALCCVVYITDVPNPNVILMVGLTFFTTIYGYAAGAVASAVMVAYSMFFFSENHDWVTFTPLNLEKMAVIVVGAVASTLLIGGLKRRQVKASRQLSEINRMLRIDNQNLDEASLTDPLTGVRNRFGLRRDYAQYENRYVHVMMLDLDDFKRINDTYGHPVGDFILKRVGRVLSESFGAENCYRYGGDEFLIICKDVDADAFPDRLDTFKQGVNAIYLNDKHLSARFSAGYVYGDCEYSDDLRLMMHQADGNLYEAKKQGRNCWVGTPFFRESAKGMEQNARAKERRGGNLGEWF